MSVFIYFLFKYVNDSSNKNFVILLITSLFFHYTFIFVFLSVFFLRYRAIKLYIILFYLSLIITPNIQFLIDSLYSFLPGFLQMTYDTYTGEQFLDSLNKSSENLAIHIILLKIQSSFFAILRIFLYNSNFKKLSVFNQKILVITLIIAIFKSYRRITFTG